MQTMERRDARGALGCAPVRKTLTVVVADDHPLFLEAVAQLVKRLPDFDLVGRAASGGEVIELLRTTAPDVAVVDLELGDMTSYAVLDAVSREELATRALVLSDVVDPEIAYRLVEAGAAGVIGKDATFGEIADAIMSVARGETVLAARVQAALMTGVRERRDQPAVVLTERELVILTHLARGNSAPDIGRELHLSASTVKTYLQRVYLKLGVSDRAAAVAEGMRRGLIR